MKKFLLLITVVLAVLSAGSCKSQYELLLESSDSDAKYKAAMELFEQGKYSKAATLFENLSIMVSGTERDDTVQYYWGLSNYRFQDYMTAETNFDKFLENFPLSPFAEDAQFLKIDCLYRSTLRYELDQTPTYTAITAISEYMINYPGNEHLETCHLMLEDLGERLDRKAFENAKIYYTMEDYMSAGVALRNVLKDDAENQYREDILYYIAMSSYKYANMSVKERKKERFLVFIDDYLNFMEEYPESRYSRELTSLYNKVKENN